MEKSGFREVSRVGNLTNSVDMKYRALVTMIIVKLDAGLDDL